MRRVTPCLGTSALNSMILLVHPAEGDLSLFCARVGELDKWLDTGLAAGCAKLVGAGYIAMASSVAAAASSSMAGTASNKRLEGRVCASGRENYV